MLLTVAGSLLWSQGRATCARCRKAGLFWARRIHFDRQKHQSRQIKWAEGVGKSLLTSRIGPTGPQLSSPATWPPTCFRKLGKEKRKQERSSRSVSASGAGGREEEEERREAAPRELNGAGPGREGLSGAVRSEPGRPAHRRAGAGPRRVSPGIGRREGVTLGRYQQPGAAEPGGGGCGTAGSARGEWPGNGRAGGGREPQWRRRLGAVSAAWGCPSPEAAGAAGPHRTAPCGRPWSEPRARQVSGVGAGRARDPRPRHGAAGGKVRAGPRAGRGAWRAPGGVRLGAGRVPRGRARRCPKRSPSGRWRVPDRARLLPRRPARAARPVLLAPRRALAGGRGWAPPRPA